MKKGIVPLLRKIFGAVYSAFLTYSKFVLIVLVIIVVAQVTARLFHASLTWSEEVALLLMVWMAFLSMAIGVHEDLHISIHLFYDHFPKRLQKIADFVNQVIILVLGLLMVVNGWRLLSITSKSTLPMTKWPSSMLYLMIPVAGFYIILCILARWFLHTDTPPQNENAVTDEMGRRIDL